MKEMEVYTMEQWAKDGTFKAKPGQLVEESIYWQMVNCVPPRSLSRNYMQVGEPYGYDFDKHCDTYSTFARENGMWRFLGELPLGEGKPRIKDFSDLVFEPYPVGLVKQKKAIMYFDNGYGVSVICGTLFYSNGVDTYEVAVLKDGDLCYTTSITDDVLPRLSKQEVSDIMARVQRL